MTNEEAIKLIDDRMCFGRGRWSEHHRPVIDEYWQAGEMAIKALEAEPHWIPVTERLPDKENKSYWICTNTGYQCQCRWTDNIYGLGSIGDRWGWKKVDIPQYTYVTAWMPLPESYKEVTT